MYEDSRKHLSSLISHLGKLRGKIFNTQLAIIGSSVILAFIVFQLVSPSRPAVYAKSGSPLESIFNTVKKFIPSTKKVNSPSPIETKKKQDVLAAQDDVKIQDSVSKSLDDLDGRLTTLENQSFFNSSSSFSQNDSSVGINLIRNSSFESASGEKPRQWSYIYDSTTSNTKQSKEGIRSGSYGLKFAGATSSVGGSDLGISQPETETVPQRTYTLSLYLKHTNVSGDTFVRLGFWDKYNNTFGPMKTVAIAGTKDWYRISSTVETTGLITDYANWYPMLEVRGLKEGGAVYFDDVQLEEGSVITVYNSAVAGGTTNSFITTFGDGSILGTTTGTIYPAQNGVGSFGTSSNKWKDLYLSKATINENGDLSLDGDATVKGDLTVNDSTTLKGNVTFGDSSSDTITFTGTPSFSANSTFTGGITVGANGEFVINSSGNITKLRGVTYSFPSSQGSANNILINDGSGTLSWGTFGSASVTADSLDFAQFADAMTVDADTSINLYNSGATDLRFYNSNASSELLFLDSSTGRIGIGTTAPAYKLEVNGSALAGGILLSSSDIGLTTDADLLSLADNALTVNGTVTVGTLADGATDTVLTHSSGTLQSRTIDSRAWGSSLLDFSGTNTNYIPYFSDSNTLAASAIYQSGGNIGIGTTAPGDKLAVVGGAVIGSSYASGITAPSNGLLVQGNVGIGTTSPSRVLTVANSGDLSTNTQLLYLKQSDNYGYSFNINDAAGGDMYIKGVIGGAESNIMNFSRGGATGGTAGVEIIQNSLSGNETLRLTQNTTSYGYGGRLTLGVTGYPMGAVEGIADASGQGSLRFYTYTSSPPVTEKMRIDYLGRVGIGTTLPASLLDVAGTTWLRGVAGGTSGLFVDSSGNVGIGTTAPGYKLDVTGTGNVSGLMTAGGFDATGNITLGSNLIWSGASRIYGANDGNILLSNNAINNFGLLQFGGTTSAFPALKRSSTELQVRLADDSGFGNLQASQGIFNGNVGIGTTAPGASLHVAGSTGIKVEQTKGTIHLTTTSNLNPALNKWELRVRDIADGDFTIYDVASSANRLYINSGGNVGIGTTSPGAKLEVNGTTGLMIKDTSGNNPKLILQESIGVNNSWNEGQIDVSGRTMRFLTEGTLALSIGANGNGRISSPTFGFSLDTGRLALKKQTGDTVLYLGLKENDVLTTGGYDFLRMINSSNTTTFFRVSDIGNMFFKAGNYIAPISDATNALNIANAAGAPFVTFDSTNGFVGIGTTNPGAKLEVAGGGKFGYLGSGITAPSNGLLVQGNVGIGTTNPGAKLEVAGGGKFGYLGSTITAPSNGLLVQGNVGIGNTNPAYKLDVNGDINTTGDIRKNGTAYNNPDYVFEPDYELMSLEDLKIFVAENKHLPGVPSSEDILRDGVKLFEQTRLNLEKTEEAYLYLFDLDDRVSDLSLSVPEMQSQLNNVILGRNEVTTPESDSGQARMTTQDTLQLPVLDESKVATLSSLLDGVEIDNETGAWEVKPEVTFLGKLVSRAQAVFEKAVMFMAEVVFEKPVQFLADVTFKGRITYEDKDKAGTATIKKGTNQVIISFDKEYTIKPLVNISLSLEGDDTANNILGKNYTYAIVDVNTKGFKIRLNKSADEALTFTWTALLVKDAKHAESEEGRIPAPTQQQEQTSETPTPTTNTPSSTVTPTVVTDSIQTQEATPTAAVE